MVVVVAYAKELLDMFGAFWYWPLGDCLYFIWVHVYMALPDNVTKVFDQAFLEFVFFYILQTESPCVNSQIFCKDEPHSLPCSYCKLTGHQDKWS